MRITLLVISMIVVLGCGLVIGPEYRSTLLFRGSEAEKIAVLSGPDAKVAIPLSARGLRETMILCANLQQSYAVLLQPEEVEQSLKQTCVAAAQKISAAYPTFSTAYTYQALGLDSVDSVMVAVQRSYLTGRHESWQAQLRTRIILDRLDPSLPEMNQVLNDDIGYMLQADWGRRWLTTVYAEDTVPRDAIKKVLETQPEAVQAAFIRELRRSAASVN